MVRGHRTNRHLIRNIPAPRDMRNAAARLHPGKRNHLCEEPSMKTQSLLKKSLLLLTTAAAALGFTVSLPMKKAAAQPRDQQMAPGAMMMNRRVAKMEIIQPRFVNPTAVNLLNITHMALSDSRLAEEIFRNPDAVAVRFHLSRNEAAVLRHMDRQQFEVARADASHLVAERMSHASMMRLPPGATDARLITERMIVGRAILAAVGRSYLDAADAHGCCPWSKSIELGVSGDPALYNAVFARRADMMGGMH
jgi:hypothetical protein